MARILLIAVAAVLFASVAVHASTPDLSISATGSAAPVPPPGAVKSASDFKPKPAGKPAAPAKAAPSPAHSHAADILKGINEDAANSLPPSELSAKWVQKISSRLSLIRDAQDASPPPADESAHIRSEAQQVIARQIAKVLRNSAAALKRAEAGNLTSTELEAIKAGKQIKFADNGAQKPSATANTYEAHAQNPRHKLRKLKQKLSANSAPAPSDYHPAGPGPYGPGPAGPGPYGPGPAGPGPYGPGPNGPGPNGPGPAGPGPYGPGPAGPAPTPAAAPRFQQLPPGTVADGENERLMQTVKTVLDLDNPSAGYKGHVNAQGKLCPTCNPIVYRADSPLSDHDVKSLRAQHEALPVRGTPLHSQETLDRASLTVDEADETRKSMLDKYPSSDSLIQFEMHN